MRKFALLIFMMAAVLSANAQHGLHTNELFEGRVIPQERMVETKARGRAIAKYQLSFFHSLRFNASEGETRRITELVEKDMRGNYKRVANGRSLTYMLQLEPQGTLNRYLCYKAVKEKKSYRVTVIYMEGALSSLDKMNEILK